MVTDVIVVSTQGNRMETALEQAEKVAAYKGLAKRDELQLRLLTEEMMGLVRSITGKKEGRFWIEDQDGEYKLHLQVDTRLTSEKREQLLAVSATGKNESAKGIMGRLRDFFDWGSDEDLASSPLYLPDMYEYSSVPALDYEWSMVRYETALSQRMEKDESAREAWDELEKSVVKHVADDVRVSIRNGVVELIILKIIK